MPASRWLFALFIHQHLLFASCSLLYGADDRFLLEVVNEANANVQVAYYRFPLAKCCFSVTGLYADSKILCLVPHNRKTSYNEINSKVAVMRAVR